MGPKNFLLNLTDASSKDMSMMDRLCLKLEAMCLDADKNPSLLFQEASKYVENQMSTVGSNMRKLCVEIIRDLLPPSALNASGATEADDNTVKLVEEELEQFHPHKQVQQSSTPHQHRVDHENTNNGLNTGVDNAKSDLEERRLLELAKIGDKTQQPADKKDAMSDVPLRCKAECLSDTFRELGRNVPESSEDMSSLLNTRSQPTFEINEDLEQYAYWYVDSEYREDLIQKMFDSIPSLRHIENDKKGHGCDELDSDWELL